MSVHQIAWFRRSTSVGIMAAAALLFSLVPASARVTRIIIDATGTLAGQDIPHETLTGRAFGELDPNDPQNTFITDIDRAPRLNGKVGNIATFFIVKTVD